MAKAIPQSVDIKQVSMPDPSIDIAELDLTFDDFPFDFFPESEYFEF